MRKFERLSCPSVLLGNEEVWGAGWQELLARNEGAKFRWRIVEKKSLNEHLLPVLKEQTQEHCSFCDAFPVSPPSKDTIEHFRPKSTFPLEAYTWANLYFCCDFCQSQKRDQFDVGLLRPDASDYDFQRYFIWDYTRGTLAPNPSASPEDRVKAEVSIRIYGLNNKHPLRRKEEQRRMARIAPVEFSSELDQWAYRDFHGL